MPEGRKLRSLRDKIVRPVFLMTILAGIAISLVAFYFTWSNSIASEQHHIESLAEEKVSSIERVFQSETLVIETLADQPILIDFFSQTSELRNTEEMLERLEAFNLGGQYHVTYLLDPEGNVLVSTDPTFYGKNFGFRSYFQEAINGGTGVEMAIGVVSGVPGYYFSHGVLKNDGTLGGVVVIKVKDETMTAMMHSVDNHLMFVDDFGIILYSSRDDERWKSLGPLSEEEQKQITDSKRFNFEITSSISRPLLQETVSRHSLDAFFSYSTPEGNVYAVMNHFEKEHFYLIIETDVDAISYQIGIQAGIIFLVILIFAFVIGLLVYILTSHQLKAFRTLVSSIEEIRAGRLLKIEETTKTKEIRQIVTVLNMMLARQRKTQESIELQIQERTEELERSNRMLIGRELRMIELKRALADIQSGKASPRLPQMIDWKKRFADAASFEEEVIIALGTSYQQNVMNAQLSPNDEQRIQRLLDILIRESKEHRQALEELSKTYEG
ncbi:MAG: cache domain-containing protein [Patescibacteria group bacterium]|jgi:C4-dicarboxylate-specific signal transduction histidine kinase